MRRNGFVCICIVQSVGMSQSTVRRSPLVAIVCIALLLIVPYSAANSGLGFAGVAESENTMGAVVKYSPDGDILASGHKNSILISDALTGNINQEFLVDFSVESIEFTSDAAFLIIGMESELPNTPGTVVFERNEDGQYSRSMHTEDGINVDEISISHDNLFFATATESGAITEWHVNLGSGSNLQVNRSYPEIHTSRINCIDHSNNGAHLLSGGDDGTVILWDRSNQTEVTRWDTVEPINDCTFSPDGTKMTWISGGSLFIRNYDQTYSYSGQFDVSELSSQIEYVDNNQNLCILVDTITDVPRHLIFINASTLPIQIEKTLYPF